MSVTFTGAGVATAASGASPQAVTTATAFAVGDYLVALIAYDNSGGGGADPMSGTISVAPATGAVGASVSAQTGHNDPGTASSGLAARCVAFPVTTAIPSSTSVNVSWSGTIVVRAVAFMKVSSGATIGYRTNSGATGGNTVGATASTALVTPSVTNAEGVLCWAAHENGAAVTGDADTTNGSWSAVYGTFQGSGATGMAVYFQSKVVTATATQSFSATGTSSDWITGCLIFTETALIAAASTVVGTGTTQNPSKLADSLRAASAVAGTGTVQVAAAVPVIPAPATTVVGTGQVFAPTIVAVTLVTPSAVAGTGTVPATTLVVNEPLATDRFDYFDALGQPHRAAGSDSSQGFDYFHADGSVLADITVGAESPDATTSPATVTGTGAVLAPTINASSTASPSAVAGTGTTQTANSYVSIFVYPATVTGGIGSSLAITTVNVGSNVINSAGGAGPFTASYTIPSGTNRLLLVWVTIEDNVAADRYATAVTLDGVALTEAIAHASAVTSSINGIGLWYMKESDLPSGTKTLSVSVNTSIGVTQAGIAAHCVMYGNVDQATLMTGTASGIGTTSATTFTLNVTAAATTDLVVAGFIGQAGATAEAASSPAADHFSAQSVNAQSWVALSYLDTPSAGVNTITWGTGTQTRHAKIGSALRAGVGGIPAASISTSSGASAVTGTGATPATSPAASSTTVATTVVGTGSVNAPTINATSNAQVSALTVTAVGVTTGVDVYGLTVLADSPWGYWRLDGSGSDTVGSHPGTPDAGVTWVTGQVGQGARLHGGTELISVGTGDQPGSNTEMTVEAWFNLGAAPSAIGGLVSSDYNGVDITQKNFFLRMQIQGTVRAGFYVGGVLSVVTSVPSSAALCDGQWHHAVAVKRNGVGTELYIDGVFNGTAPQAATGAIQNSASSPITLGHYGATTDAFGLDGPLDECAIYTSALAPTRILSHYRAGLSTLSVATSSTVTPSVVTGTGSTLSTSPAASSATAATTVTGSGVVPAPTIGLGARADATAVVGTGTVNAPTIDVSGSTIALAATVIGTGAVAAPTISTSSTALPAAVVGTGVVQTVAIGLGATVLAVTVTGGLPVSGAITHDATSNPGTFSNTSLSWSHTIGAGTSRKLIVVAGGESTGTSQFPGTPTYNGVAMHQAMASDWIINGIGSNWAIAYIWYLDDSELPAAGSYTVALAWSIGSRFYAAATSLYGAAQGAPEATAKSTSNTATPISTTIVGASQNAWVIAALASTEAGSYTPDSGQTERSDQTYGVGTSFCHGTLQVNAGDTAIQWTGQTYKSQALASWAVAGVAGLPVPTILTSSGASTTVVAGTGATPSASPAASSTAAATTVTGTGSVSSPTINTGSNAVAPAVTVTGTGTANSPTLVASSTSSASTVTGTGSVPTPSRAASSTTAATTVTGTGVTASPTLSVTMVATPSSVSGTGTTYAPTISASGNAIATPSTVTGTGTTQSAAPAASSKALASTVIGRSVGDSTWSPSSLTGMTVWIDASQLGLSHNDPVSPWTNLGSGGNGTIVGTPAPVLQANALNGKPSVKFTATEGRVRGTGMVVDGSFDLTVMYVGRTWGTNFGRIFSNVYPPYNFLVGAHTSLDATMYDAAFVGGVAWSTFPTPWRLFGAVCQGTPSVNSTFYINGAEIGSTANSTGHDDQWNISGYDATGTQETADCEVTELVALNVPIYGPKRLRLESYFSTKYGFTAFQVAEGSPAAVATPATVVGTGSVLSPSISISLAVSTVTGTGSVPTPTIDAAGDATITFDFDPAVINIIFSGTGGGSIDIGEGGAVDAFPGSVLGTGTVFSVSFIASSIAVVATVTGTGVVQVPTRNAATLVSPATVVGTGIVQSPAKLAGSITAAATVAGTGAVQAPILIASSKATPATVTGTGVVQTAAPQAGQTVLASTVTGTGTVLVPTPLASSLHAASTVVGTGTVQVPGRAASSTHVTTTVIGTGVVQTSTQLALTPVAPSVVIGIGTVLTATPTTTTIVVTTTVLGTGVTQTAAVHAASTASANTVVGTGTVYLPTTQLILTATPSTVIGTGSTKVPGISAGLATSATTVTGTGTVYAVSFSLSSKVITTTVVGLGSVPLPSLGISSLFPFTFTPGNVVLTFSGAGDGEIHASSTVSVQTVQGFGAVHAPMVVSPEIRVAVFTVTGFGQVFTATAISGVPLPAITVQGTANVRTVTIRTKEIVLAITIAGVGQVPNPSPAAGARVVVVRVQGFGAIYVMHPKLAIGVSTVTGFGTVLAALEFNMGLVAQTVKGTGSVQTPGCHRRLQRSGQGHAVSDAFGSSHRRLRRTGEGHAVTDGYGHGIRVLLPFEGDGRTEFGERVVGWDADPSVNSQERLVGTAVGGGITTSDRVGGGPSRFSGRGHSGRVKGDPTGSAAPKVE